MLSIFPSRTVALAVGPVSVHWYGIMYLLGFFLGANLLERLQHLRGLSMDRALRERLLFSVLLGVLLGGRLGFVAFYGGGYYLENPLEIFAVWKGGMSSHGGFLGVAIFLVLFARKSRVPLLALIDVLAVPIAVGLALGRIGNLINGELYGTVTTLPWGMSFASAEGLRHPTQIYAAIKDLLIALLCFLHLRRTAGRAFGTTTGIFLMSYSTLRFVVEIFREQPYGYIRLFVDLSRGQALTVPLFVLGFLVYLRARKQAGT